MGFPGGSDSKEPTCYRSSHERREAQAQSLGWGDSLEKGLTIHSSVLAWRIQGAEEPAGHSPWGRKRRAQLSN